MKAFTEKDRIELAHQFQRTESMDEPERQYWIDMLPSMTDEQKHKLLDILVTEDKKLQELEAKYHAEISSLCVQNQIEWNAFQALDYATDIANVR